MDYAEKKRNIAARAGVEARINDATIPHGDKIFATRLLARNATVGATFRLSMAQLRGVRHAVTNLDVMKSLARLRRVGLISYELDFRTQVVALRFHKEQ